MLTKWRQMITSRNLSFEQMGILLFSLLLYLMGIAALLYLKPKLMFLPNGRWKEFGVGSDETTLFPFWMFCIFWAIICYSLSLLLIGTSVAAVASASLSPDNSVMPLGASGAAKPGYYKLNANVTKKKGAPQYIYVGTEPPEDFDS
jgi:hypothetical protein